MCGSLFQSAAPKGGVSSENDFSLLAAPERERLDLVYVRVPMMQLRGRGFRTTCALSPHPLQRLGQRLAAEVPPLLVRKLADGEVCLLLAGTRSTEGHTQDLHLCSTGARALRPALHLARYLLRHPLGQGNPPSETF